MSGRKVILMGGPDSGKTNYFARLWAALDDGNGAISAAATPNEIEYVEEALAHLHGGGFAPRTDKSLEGSLNIPLVFVANDESITADLVIPDMSGEIWKNAVETNELAPQWRGDLESAIGALLFVRVLSPLNVDPRDWVNTADLMRFRRKNVDHDNDLSTQVMLCELLRFLELTLGASVSAVRPSLSVVVTAWDLLDPERAAFGPAAFLKQEYPLFSGRLEDVDSFDIATFGVSVVGGDLSGDTAFRAGFLKSDFKSTGYVIVGADSSSRQHGDLTLPVAWAIGSRQPLY
jgi:hypothetical protein